MNDKQKVEFVGITMDGVFSGHVVYEGKSVATIKLELPGGFWPSQIGKRNRGRPQGRMIDRVREDITVLAVSDIVEEHLEMAGRKATVQEMLTFITRTLNPRTKESWEETLKWATDETNKRKFLRQKKAAKLALEGFKVVVQQAESTTINGIWLAFAPDGRAWLYPFGGELKQVMVEKSKAGKSGAQIIRMNEKRTK